MTRIIVVDDRPLDAANAVRLLREIRAWEVEQYANGEDALAALQLVPCDLLITDLHMPGMDGLTLLNEVHQLLPGLPVVVMTSRGNETKAVTALEAGAASYLPKSRLASDLVGTCHRVLDSARLERDQAALLEHLVEERFEIAIENERRHVPGIVDLIASRCLQFQVCGQGRAPRIGVAIEEAVINAMVHGNLEVSSELREESYELYEDQVAARLEIPRYRDRRVIIQVHVTRETCRITIRDEGPGFDPDALPDPTDPENVMRVSGRGILLMRAFLDEVIYEQDGRQVQLVIRRADELASPVATVRRSKAASSV